MTKDYIDAERSRCMDILSKRPNLKVYNAYANFILVKLLDGTTSFEMFERCIKHGLMIRDCASFHGLDGEFIRFCIQTKEHNEPAVRIIKIISLTYTGITHTKVLSYNKKFRPWISLIHDWNFL